jgi:penicillin-binding protein 1B
MQSVVNSGTGAGVRSRGFTLPAAGKTGTSRDGWFAGYTKDFLVIAWVGYDDNRDLNLEGARSALPIWTEFMQKAQKLYPVNPDDMYFDVPDGIEFADVDLDSGELANGSCVNTSEEVFIEGTAPTVYCTLHGAKISETLERTIGEPAREAGKGVGKAIGRFFGGLFGGGGDDKEENEKPKP